MTEMEKVVLFPSTKTIEFHDIFPIQRLYDQAHMYV